MGQTCYGRSMGQSLSDQLKAHERRTMLRALTAAGSLRRASADLGISRTDLKRRAERHGIDLAPFTGDNPADQS